MGTAAGEMKQRLSVTTVICKVIRLVSRGIIPLKYEGRETQKV